MEEAGFSIKTRSDGIMVYHITDVRRKTIDAFFETMVQHDHEAAAEGRHLRRLFLITTSIMPSPYSVEKLNEAGRLTPKNLRESNAVIIENSLTRQILAMVINRLPVNMRSVTRIFANEDLALSWLDERLEALGK